MTWSILGMECTWADIGVHWFTSTQHGDLAVPVTRTTRYSPRSFAIAGLSTWN